MSTRRQPPKVPRPDPVRRAVSPVLAALAADPTPEAVERFWADRPLPLIEPAPADAPPGHHLVTFCWREEAAEEVLLFVNRITDETRLAESLMARIPGTDVWHVGYVMEADWRASYCFLVRRRGEPAAWLGADNQVAIRAALDRGHADPRNPDTCRNRAGVPQSVLALPAAPAQPWLAERPEVARGSVEALSGPLDRELWAYTAPGVGAGAPLLLVLDGEVWTSAQSLPTMLDNLVADRAIPPLRAIFLASGGRDARWSEMSGSDGVAGYVADFLAADLRGRGWWPDDPGKAAVVGQSLGGLTGLRLGLARPDLIGVVLSQSASLWLDELGAELAAYPASPTTDEPGLRIHLAHGRQEWVLAGPHRELAVRLEAAGVEVLAAEYNGGHDYAWWRGAVADALVWGFGAER